MIRLALIAVPFAVFLTEGLPRAVADEAKGEKVEYARFPDYFEKNNSGLKGDQSFLVFADKDAFGKVFALRPPLMGQNKAVALPSDAFDKKLVFAVISRGNAITTYNVEKVTADGDTLYVQYKAEMGKANTAKFASPLVL